MALPLAGVIAGIGGTMWLAQSHALRNLQLAQVQQQDDERVRVDTLRPLMAADVLNRGPYARGRLELIDQVQEIGGRHKNIFASPVDGQHVVIWNSNEGPYWGQGEAI